MTTKTDTTTEERLIALMEASEQRAATRAANEEAAQLRAWAFAVAAQEAAATTRSEDLNTPSKTEETRITTGKNGLEQRGWTAADAEVMAMIVEGARGMARPENVAVSEDVTNFYNAKVRDARSSVVVDDNGDYVRAMDSAESGFGLQLIGAQYATELWAATRNEDDIVNLIREVPMTAATLTVPIDGALPEVSLIAESTSPTQSANATAKTPSNKATLTAKTFNVNQVWSSELNEDSLIAFVPFLRAQLAKSVAFHVGSAFYNGDTTNAATGNINLDDADPADTKHFLAFDGIRKSWLVTDSAKKDMAGALDFSEILKARGKLNAGVDDINAGATGPNWGRNVKDLVLVCDNDTYMALLNGNDFVTVEKYGAQATVLTGELGRIYGIPVLAPQYASKTEADGKASTTEASNTKGQITVFNKNGFLAGGRSDVQLFFDRVQRTNQYLVELYFRKGFVRHSANVAAGIYDITV